MPLPETVTALPPTGSLTTTVPEDVLRFCEKCRFSGTLAFQSDVGRGILPMLNGVPEVAAGDLKLESALDQFVELKSGRYILTQMLPALEGSTAEGELGVRGGLDRVTVLDLLRYCEGAGLTGNLTLHHSDRTCVARYDHGELSSFTVDNEADADLANVFAWATGTFSVQARSAFDESRASTEPQERLMQTLELALAQILEKSQHGAERAHPGTAPSMSPPSMLRGSTLPFGLEGGRGVTPGAGKTAVAAEPAPAVTITPSRRTVSPPPQNAESTVKIFFRDKGGSPSTVSTRHASAGLGSEVVPLGDTSAALDAIDPADVPPLPPPAKSPEFTSQFGAVGKPMPASAAAKIAGAVSLAATAREVPPAKPSGTMGAVVPATTSAAKPSGTMGAVVPATTPAAKPSGTMGAVVPATTSPPKQGASTSAPLATATPIAKPSGAMGAVVPSAAAKPVATTSAPGVTAAPAAKPSGSMSAVVPSLAPASAVAAGVPGATVVTRPETASAVPAVAAPASKPSGSMAAAAAKPGIGVGSSTKPATASSPTAANVPGSATTKPAATSSTPPIEPAAKASVPPVAVAESVPAPTASAAAQPNPPVPSAGVPRPAVRPGISGAAPFKPSVGLTPKPATAASGTHAPKVESAAPQSVRSEPAETAIATTDAATVSTPAPDASTAPVPAPTAESEPVENERTDWDDIPDPYDSPRSKSEPAQAIDSSSGSPAAASHGSSPPGGFALATESITDDSDKYPAMSSSVQLSRETAIPARNTRRGALTFLFATTLVTTVGVAGYLLFGLVR